MCPIPRIPRQPGRRGFAGLFTRDITAAASLAAGHPAPNAPGASSFDLILHAAAGSALGGSGTPYTLTISAIDLTAVTQGWPTLTLHQSFDAASGWKPSGTGPGYQCAQTFPVPVPGGGPGRPLAGHTVQCVASLIGRDTRIVSIIHSNPFVLV